MISTTEIRQRLDRREYFLRKFEEAQEKHSTLKIKTMLSADEKFAKNPVDGKAWQQPLDKTCCVKGSGIASWSCSALCYCHNFIKDRPNIYPAQLRAFTIAQLPEFADVMIGAILKSAVPAFRIHSFGDFNSVEYIQAWTTIVKECDGVVFLAYTRAWRVAEFIPALTDLAALPNMNLYLSYDRDTGIPPEIPQTRRSWLACNDNDPPLAKPHKQDVIFRGTDEMTPERPPDRRYVKLNVLGGNLGGYFVCPHQTGMPTTSVNEDCVSCRHCFFKERS